MIDYVSPRSGLPLCRAGDWLVSKTDERFPLAGGIPRFVSGDGYAAAFGLEWTMHAKTQVDSRTWTHLSRARLERCLGRPLSTLEGLQVLEAGCGAGRFTELLVDAGAHVHSIDLSVAVEANRQNIGERPNYVVAQADLLDPPFPRAAFDVVVCLGVLQHVPDPEAGIRSLYAMVKPGGGLVIDHYRWSLSFVMKLAPLYRELLRRMPPARAKVVSDRLVGLFFPLHRAARHARLAQMMLSRVSPCLVYFNAYPQLTMEQQYDLCRLDTFDSLTDRYKHLRTVGQVRDGLQALGAIDVWVARGGNGVEARCRKPAAG